MGRRKTTVRSLEERFWSRVNKTKTCWLWTASCKKGYGQIWDGTKISAAHRLAWEIANGPITGGLWVLHKCDVRACVRPSHLFLGDVADNQRDMKNKGRRKGIRSVFGEDHGMAKLCESQVLEIRELAEAGIWSKRKIARYYGVAHPLISMIHKRKVWRHL